jgi:hypothetical protein
MQTYDDLWDCLREVCCVTKPHTDAKRIVMLSRADLVKALILLERKQRHDQTQKG